MSVPVLTHRFQAMASPCEILLEEPDTATAEEISRLAEAEALRIEQKFSRYRQDNIVHRINHAGGKAVTVDGETARLLDFAAQLHGLSDGAFDITSGVLRHAWCFDGSDRLPEASVVSALLGRVGWEKVSWRPPQLCLPEGMELDLGGIGKEYAVDRVFELLSSRTSTPFLVNFGGDLRCRGPRHNGEAWRVGVEDPGQEGGMVGVLELAGGAVATSGDARRFLLRDGVRYGHILDPRTGWPVVNAPRSVTVMADTCVEAGMLSTLAMLAGADAEAFLDGQGVRYRIVRGE